MLKSGVKAGDHAIIYTEDNPPRAIPGERFVKQPVKVQPKTPRDKLEPISRLNYAKIYTVEHNVKVLFIGRIAPESEKQFFTDFDDAWLKKRQMNPD